MFTTALFVKLWTGSNPNSQQQGNRETNYGLFKPQYYKRYSGKNYWSQTNVDISQNHCNVEKKPETEEDNYLVLFMWISRTGKTDLLWW